MKEIKKIKEINKIKDIGQRAIDIMNEVLKNITSLETEVQNDDEMQKMQEIPQLLEMQKLAFQQEIQPLVQEFLEIELIQEAREKILLLEEVQKAYKKINQHMQQILRYVQNVKQQLQELKNQMHVILEIGQYEHEELPENELEVVLEQMKGQLRMLHVRGLDTLPANQVSQQVNNEVFHYHFLMNLPFIEQEFKDEKTLKFNVTTTFQKIVQVCQTHEHMGKKIQQEMQQLQEQAKKIETTPLMQQRLEQHVIVQQVVQTQMEWIQEKAKLIENQATTLWDEHYMKIACLAALRSKDPSTPVSY